MRPKARSATQCNGSRMGLCLPPGPATTMDDTQRQQRMNVVGVPHCCLRCLRADTASPATGPVTCVLRVGLAVGGASLRGASKTRPPSSWLAGACGGKPPSGARQVVAVHYVARGPTLKKVWTDCSSSGTYSHKSACFRTPPGVFAPRRSVVLAGSIPFPSGTERFRSGIRFADMSDN